jgi:ABC-type sugar transport system ATPase subunit
VSGALQAIAEAHGVRKRFGAVRAVDDATLAVRPGEVHCLIGENGAGKTTLVRMFAGLIRPDAGILRLRGIDFQPADPRSAAEAGVRVLSQEFALAPNISITENLALGSESFRATCRGGRFSWTRADAWARDALQRNGVDVDPRTQVDRLSVSQRQLVALVRCTLDDPAVLFLDEPSSALDSKGVQTLEQIVRRLRAAGVSLVYVSHKLDEIFALGDRVTVLRDGTTRATLEVAETNEAELVQMMVGRQISRLFPERGEERAEHTTVLEVRDLHAPGVNGVSFAVRQGEILGIGGLVGAGRTEVARAVSGLADRPSGDVVLDGVSVDCSRRERALGHGIEYVTEDRLGEGLVLLASIADNITARVMHRFKRGPFLSRRAQERFAAEQISRFRIVAPNAAAPVGTLSGGNQQKVLLAACLASEPRVIFFDEPTRGIDIGAKQEIYEMIRALSETMGVVVISAELLELLGLADRVLVMRGGRIVAELAGEEATEQRVVAAALGSGGRAGHDA